jgi:hypothetical protein
MANVKILVEVDHALAERIKDLAMKGAFGVSAASSSFNFNQIMNSLICQALEAGDKKLMEEQRKTGQTIREKESSLGLDGIQTLRFTRERRVIRPLEVIA